MSYLARNENENNSYLDLKFNLEMDEAIVVAGKVRDLCSYDIRAFFFLANYLIASCSNLER